MEKLEDPRHQRLLEYLCTRKGERRPTTMAALADELGVHVRTLRDWREKPEFIAAHEAMVRRVGGGPERFQEVLDALHETATGSDQKLRAGAAKLWSEMTGFLSSQVSAPKGKTTDLTDEQLAELVAAKAAEQLQARGMRVINGGTNDNHRQAG